MKTKYKYFQSADQVWARQANQDHKLLVALGSQDQRHSQTQTEELQDTQRQRLKDTLTKILRLRLENCKRHKDRDSKTQTHIMKMGKKRRTLKCTWTQKHRVKGSQFFAILDFELAKTQKVGECWNKQQLFALPLEEADPSCQYLKNNFFTPMCPGQVGILGHIDREGK